MPAFNYAALTASGKEKKGTLEGDSDRQIRQQLRDQGMIPLKVNLTMPKESLTANLGQMFSPHARGRLSAEDLALLTRQLATLIQASIPVEEALRAVAKQAAKAKIRGIALAVRSKVNEGYTLAKAMSEYPNTFPDLYRATVSAGEHSGHLDLVLEQLASYTESSSETQRKIKGALVYPIILLFFSMAILIGLMVYVVPQIIGVVGDSGQDIPQVTLIVMAMSDFLVANWVYLLIFVALIPAVGKLAFRSPKILLKAHALQLKLPLVGRLTRGLNAARICNTLSILASSGVQVVDALRISGEVASNLHIRKAVLTAADRVREGGSLHRGLDQSGYFPPMMIQMIAAGENSGELDNMLQRAANNQEREMVSIIGTIVSLFEPLIMVFMGGTVMVIVMAIMLPIINLSNVG